MPHLYRTMVFLNYTEVDRWNSFYYNALEATRGSAAQIRSMMLRNGPSSRPIIKDCLNIQHLVVVPDSQYEPMRPHATFSSSLTHVALHGVLYVHPLSLPPFRTVTHIHIPDDIPFYSSEFSPASLPNLTHVVWTLIPGVDFCIWHVFPNWIRALHKFSTLRLVAVYIYSASKLSIDMDLNSATRPIGVSTYDLPIFLIDTTHRWTECDSESWIMGGESIWERTARVLLTRGACKPLLLGSF